MCPRVGLATSCRCLVRQGPLLGIYTGDAGLVTEGDDFMLLDSGLDGVARLVKPR